MIRSSALLFQKKFYVLMLASSIFFVSCSTKYYIVRHAEKLNNTDTSSLTDAGRQRAIQLKDLLLNEGIDYIYASKYIRTQLTAKPLAESLGKSLIIYNPDTTQGLSEKLESYSGSSILVIGHTNIIPEIVNYLSKETISPIAENDFDNLYVIEVKKNLGWISRYLTSSTYGLPSP